MAHTTAFSLFQVFVSEWRRALLQQRIRVSQPVQLLSTAGFLQGWNSIVRQGAAIVARAAGECLGFHDINRRMVSRKIYPAW
jgi:hypothetical protein